MYEPEMLTDDGVSDPVTDNRGLIDLGLDGSSAHDVEKGAVLGVAGGAVIGAFAGGPVGAVIGALAGGALSAGAVAGVDVIDNDGSVGELQDTHHDAGAPPNTTVVGPYDEPVTAPLSDPFALPPAYVGPPNGSGVYPNVVPVNYDNSTPDEDIDEDDEDEEDAEEDAIGAETNEPADETDAEDDPDSGLRSVAYP